MLPRPEQRWTLGWLALLLLVGSLRSEDAKGTPLLKVGKDQLEFFVDKELVARYFFDPGVAKPYFWPLNAPGGTTLTRGWPMENAPEGELKDHFHQKSAWFCHGDVIPEGIQLKKLIKGVAGVDFWSELPGHGKIVCVSVGSPKQSKQGAHIVTRNEWRTFDKQKILDETRGISLHVLPGAYLLVLEVDLHASVCPITFGDTKEGSLGIRVRHELTEGKGKGVLTNAEQRQREKAIWGLISPWCDYSGPIEGKSVGIAIFDDPSNPHPSCWHSRGYGLMAANPFGRAKSGFPAQKNNAELVKLARGQHLKLRYGILLHTGDVNEGKVAEHFQRFVKLGQVKETP